MTAEGDKNSYGSTESWLENGWPETLVDQGHFYMAMFAESRAMWRKTGEEKGLLKKISLPSKPVTSNHSQIN
jgi:hypothetical protein